MELINLISVSEPMSTQHTFCAGDWLSQVVHRDGTNMFIIIYIILVL